MRFCLVFIGKKVDIWFNGANQGLKKRKDIPNNVIVLVPAEILYAKEEWHNEFRELLATVSKL